MLIPIRSPAYITEDAISFLKSAEELIGRKTGSIAVSPSFGLKISLQERAKVSFPNIHLLSHVVGK